MSDEFTKEYNELKDIGKAINNDIKVRAAMDPAENTIKVH